MNERDSRLCVQFVILAAQGEKMMSNYEVNKSGNDNGGHMKKVSDDSTKVIAVFTGFW